MANETQIIVNKRSIRFIDTTTKQEYFSTFIDHLRWKRDKDDNFTFFNSVPIANNGGNENNNRLGVLIDITGEQIGVSSFVYTTTLNPDTGTHFISADVMETWLGDNTGFYFDPNPIGVVLTIGVVHDATLTGSGTVIDPLSVVATSVLTEMSYASSDATTPLVVATNIGGMFAEFDMTLQSLFAGVSVFGSTSGVTTLMIQKNGVDMLSTAITIDFGEATSLTAVVAPVISVSSILKGDRISTNVTSISGGATEAGLQVTLNGIRA